MKQTVGNACGTIGLLHAVGNLANTSLVELGMHFARYPLFVNLNGRRAMRLVCMHSFALLDVTTAQCYWNWYSNEEI